jgi:dTDP-4-amino-4,6-dideoxygalactose transaminase
MIHSKADTLAIEGGTPVRSRPWPRWPIFDETEEQAILEVVRSGKWWSVEGTKVREFEEAFARFQDAQFAVCVTNGTAALEVALRAAHIGCGDEVIVPPYTFIATATAVLAVGATPVFVDVERRA